MPTLFGAGSEFIPVKPLPHFSNEVLKLDTYGWLLTYCGGYLYTVVLVAA
ncbi:MAG: hypothetical protein IPG39_21615 [Bacteroidetes bacterium]|nr:hypothetical protein [Bacteroidota bacterium]